MGPAVQCFMQNFCHAGANLGSVTVNYFPLLWKNMDMRNEGLIRIDTSHAAILGKGERRKIKYLYNNIS